MNPDFIKLFATSGDDRRDLFLTAARRVGTTEQNVEKDLWVCWALEVTTTTFIAFSAPG